MAYIRASQGGGSGGKKKSDLLSNVSTSQLTHVSCGFRPSKLMLASSITATGYRGISFLYDDTEQKLSALINNDYTDDYTSSVMPTYLTIDNDGFNFMRQSSWQTNWLYLAVE